MLQCAMRKLRVPCSTQVPGSRSLRRYRRSGSRAAEHNNPTLDHQRRCAWPSALDLIVSLLAGTDIPSLSVAEMCLTAKWNSQDEDELRYPAKERTALALPKAPLAGPSRPPYDFEAAKAQHGEVAPESGQPSSISSAFVLPTERLEASSHCHRR